MPALAVDTATEVCSIALALPGERPDETGIDAGRTHLEVLLPAIDELLRRRGLGASSLRLIVAGTGPGTFSGLRVGIATARALAQALEIPVIGASSLAALASAAAGSEAAAGGTLTFLPVIDARRGQVFAQVYRTSQGRIQPGSEIFCLRPEELIARISESAPGAVAMGNGVLAYYELFSSSGLRLPPASSGLHRIRAACHIPAEPPRQQYSPAGLLAVQPVYVREPDADKTVLLRKREPWL